MTTHKVANQTDVVYNSGIFGHDYDFIGQIPNGVEINKSGNASTTSTFQGLRIDPSTTSGSHVTIKTEVIDGSNLRWVRWPNAKAFVMFDISAGGKDVSTLTDDIAYGGIFNPFNDEPVDYDNPEGIGGIILNKQTVFGGRETTDASGIIDKPGARIMILSDPSQGATHIRILTGTGATDLTVNDTYYPIRNIANVVSRGGGDVTYLKRARWMVMGGVI